MVENTEKQERTVFTDGIRQAIVGTFPFDSVEQRDIFSNTLESLAQDCGDLPDVEFIRNIRFTLASLENAHTHLEEEGVVKYYLERPIIYKAGKFWIEDNGVTVEVVSMQGVAIEDLVKEKMKERGGGTTEYKINRALRSLLSSEIVHSVVLGVIKENEVFDIVVRFVDEGESTVPVTSKRFVSGKMLDQHIGYLRIKSWSGRVSFDGKTVADLVEEELEALGAAKFLILDVRENGGGDSPLAEKLAGRFVKKATPYGTVFKRQASQDELVRSELELKPQGSFLDKKVVVLTGPKCLSSNEMFIMMMKDTGIAVTIGQTTGGGSGNPKSFEIALQGKTYTLKVSSWSMMRNNGDRLESIGIEPDVSVAITAEDVVQHRDAVLEAAKEYLQYNR